MPVLFSWHKVGENARVIEGSREERPQTGVGKKNEWLTARRRFACKGKISFCAKKKHNARERCVFSLSTENKEGFEGRVTRIVRH